MADLIDVADIKAWLDATKTEVTAIEGALAGQIASQVLGVVSSRYNTGTWLTAATTPLLIKRVISMFYAGYFYHRTFSNDSEPGAYGDRLLADAQILLDGIANGTITVVSDATVPVVVNSGLPMIAQELIDSEPVFSMSQEF